MRWVAFLRAVNVGGRKMPMDRLRVVVERLGFTRVETFIASGNVLFDATPAEARGAEEAIEGAVKAAFGYESDTFVRRADELAAVAACEPFTASRRASAKTFNVGFVKAVPSPEVVAQVLAHGSAVNDLHVRGREVYWLSQLSQSDPKLPKIPFERLLGGPVTFRGIKTVQRLVSKT